VEISWTSKEDKYYSVEFAWDHDGHFHEWQTINSTRIIANGSTTTFVVDEHAIPEGLTGYFRVRVLAP
jgi:hypothetical protein